MSPKEPFASNRAWSRGGGSAIQPTLVKNLQAFGFLTIRSNRTKAVVETRLEHADSYGAQRLVSVCALAFQSAHLKAHRWHILMYTAPSHGRNPTMQRRAKVFMNNRSQAVRLPKEFQFSTDEVFIRKEGEDVILSPRPTDWGPYLDSGPVASDAFMENVEDLPVQEREP